MLFQNNLINGDHGTAMNFFMMYMFMSCTDEKTPNGALYDQIKKVYDKYFNVETRYTCKLILNDTIALYLVKKP